MTFFVKIPQNRKTFQPKIYRQKEHIGCISISLKYIMSLQRKNTSFCKRCSARLWTGKDQGHCQISISKTRRQTAPVWNSVGKKLKWASFIKNFMVYRTLKLAQMQILRFSNLAAKRTKIIVPALRRLGNYAVGLSRTKSEYESEKKKEVHPWPSSPFCLMGNGLNNQPKKWLKNYLIFFSF